MRRFHVVHRPAGLVSFIVMHSVDYIIRFQRNALNSNNFSYFCSNISFLVVCLHLNVSTFSKTYSPWRLISFKPVWLFNSTAMPEAPIKVVNSWLQCECYWSSCVRAAHRREHFAAQLPPWHWQLTTFLMFLPFTNITEYLQMTSKGPLFSLKGTVGYSQITAE